MFMRNNIARFLYKKNLLKYHQVGFEYSKQLQNVFNSAIQNYSQQASTQKVKLEPKKKVESANKFANRTHTCGELTINNVNENVQLCGWLEFQRMGMFLILRDSYGSTQCIIDTEKHELSKQIQDLSYESVLKITGIVVARPVDQCNPKMKTGEIEVSVESLEVLNLAAAELPFSIRNFLKAKEALQMQYRYLALRFPELQRNLRIRSMVIANMREYLIKQCGFVDIATPTLFRKTPGGAQEFIVPTQKIGRCYSLVQSPQQFKQLLMVGGFDRYFQVAQCYRDEGSRSDRQPEFTQLDIEMSFVDRESIIDLTEQLIFNSWPEFLEPLKIPFQRITYEEAMEMYGTDAPDLRIPGRIHNISSIVHNSDENFNKSYDIYATVFKGKQQFLTKPVKKSLDLMKNQISSNAKLIQLKVSDPNLGEISKLLSETARKSIVESLNISSEDVLFISYGPKEEVRKLLGKIRVEFSNILELKGDVIRSSNYRFSWIYDFPLFGINDDKTIETTHHPFTQPHPEDIKYLFEDPLKVRGLQYDLVLNGSEIAGGSIRIHNKEFQEQILKMLNIDPSEMYYLLEALGSGAPPHGGIALGLDRYISIICGASSIREVIAFPKTMEGRDLMSGAPTLISEEDKKLYQLCISTPPTKTITTQNFKWELTWENLSCNSLRRRRRYNYL